MQRPIGWVLTRRLALRGGVLVGAALDFAITSEYSAESRRCLSSRRNLSERSRRSRKTRKKIEITPQLVDCEGTTTTYGLSYWRRAELTPAFFWPEMS